MAGSIPPLVSSTPPPLTAFDDDDEEEDEDEFGMYTVVEDIDYNECISFKENNVVKQDGGKSRGEQDSTSQDSTTDSGLCPDSEGMSPTPHSDEERTVKPSVISAYDRVYQQPSDLPALDSRLTPTCVVEGVDTSSGFSAHTNLPNGHVTAEDPEDDFGNFENFESSGLSEQSIPPDKNLDVTLIKSLEKENIIENVNSETEVLEDEGSSCNFESEHSQCKESDEHNISESEHNQDKEFYEHKEFSTVNATSIDINSKTISPSSFSSLEETGTSDNLQVYDQQVSSEEFTASNAISLKAEQNTEVTFGNEEFDQQDVEFDDFSDFKADFSKFDSPNTEQCDVVSEHSKPNLEQNHSEEVAGSVCAPPNDASEEEFSDFTEFSSSDCAFVTAQKSNSVENVSHIPNVSSDDSDLRTDSEFQDWVSVFPSSSGDPVPVEEGQALILRKNDPVWSRLFPLETSPALSYQWAESLSNRHLLTALNIDSRNILMMPWMPKFAANLSCGPLQPVKALAPEPLQPTLAPVSAPLPLSAHPSSGQESVPDAHFDWVGSGLTNPLDCPKVARQQKTLGAEAETILSALPDLSFMRKTYIDFPINEG